MTHVEFVAAFHAGRVRAVVARDAARRFVSARIMLPFLLLPVFGLGVAIALIGHYIIGALVFLAGLGIRQLVRASAQGFVIQRALRDERFYRDALAAGALRMDEEP